MYRKNCYVGMLLRSIIDQNFTYYVHRYFFTTYGGEGLWSWARTCDIWSLYKSYVSADFDISIAAEEELLKIYHCSNYGKKELCSEMYSYADDLISLHKGTNRITMWALKGDSLILAV
jgi:hypothetical protein